MIALPAGSYVQYVPRYPIPPSSPLSKRRNTNRVNQFAILKHW